MGEWRVCERACVRACVSGPGGEGGGGGGGLHVGVWGEECSAALEIEKNGEHVVVGVNAAAGQGQRQFKSRPA